MKNLLFFLIIFFFIPNYLNASNKDKVLKKIILQFPKEHMTMNTNHYHSLINSIIGQQISVSAANSIKNKFFSLHKNITPKNLIDMNNSLIKKCGLSKQKTEYINNISIFFIKNKKFIKNIHTFEEQLIREKLIQIKGVGNWTIDMFLIFSLGFKNIFPEGDLGFLKAISKSYNKDIPLDKSYLNKLKRKGSTLSNLSGPPRLNKITALFILASVSHNLNNIFYHFGFCFR